MGVMGSPFGGVLGSPVDEDDRELQLAIQASIREEEVPARSCVVHACLYALLPILLLIVCSLSLSYLQERVKKEEEKKKEDEIRKSQDEIQAVRVPHMAVLLSLAPLHVLTIHTRLRPRPQLQFYRRSLAKSREGGLREGGELEREGDEEVRPDDAAHDDVDDVVDYDDDLIYDEDDIDSDDFDEAEEDDFDTSNIDDDDEEQEDDDETA
jgi:hypothetical protein